MRYLWIAAEYKDGNLVGLTGERVNGFIECPRCHRDRPLIEDVDEYEIDTGRITGWGPGLAVCCGLLLIDSWDRASAYKLRTPDWWVRRVPVPKSEEEAA